MERGRAGHEEADTVGVEDREQRQTISDEDATAHVEPRQDIFGEHIGQDDGRERPDQQRPKHNTPRSRLADVDLSMANDGRLSAMRLGPTGRHIMWHFRHGYGLGWQRFRRRPKMPAGDILPGESMRALIGAALLGLAMLQAVAAGASAPSPPAEPGPPLGALARGAAGPGPS